ncbi:uncharacterized protein LOC131664796 isoform X2 [Phymastichus coffea]|uniref:uncharacterized protein LOC131664796 isoform X2 n=1 Tax=Phymastichus coffea TaxID=108790 RepID=UPI00273B04AC|nr:uncharacterized protein LOC131664796 isoform X2 [Phymastichus coffea]
MYSNKRPELPASPRDSRRDSRNSRAAATMSKYDRLSPHPRRRLTNAARIEQLYHHFQAHSSSDECLTRNKSKSTSSIDTQSVNNILDEFEDLDYRRSSDLSDIEVANAEVTNFEEMMNFQKRQASEKQNSRMFRSLNKVPPREQHSSGFGSPTKISRQTQVRQRSRDRLRDNAKRLLSPPDETPTRHERKNSAPTFQSSEVRASVRSAKTQPEILLRKGEVQKRVDEWLSQTRNQNCAGFTTKESRGLTRSNSSAEQKNYRRLRQQELRSRRYQLNVSSSYDDLTHDELRTDRNRDNKISVGVNTNRGTYKQYLALKSKAKLQKQQENGNREEGRNRMALRSREASPAARMQEDARNDAMNSSFRSSSSSRRDEPSEHEQRQTAQCSQLNETVSATSVRASRTARARHQMENRISSLVKARNEMTSGSLENPPASIVAAPASAVIRRSSFKRESVRSSSKSNGPSGKDEEERIAARSGQEQKINASADQSSGNKTGESNHPSGSGSDLSQEVYGSVSARIRAFQDKSDSRVPKSRSLQGSNILIETRNRSPMSPSRTDCFQYKDCDRIQSTFKPNVAAHNLPNQEQQPAKREVDVATRYVEKIYETTLQPEVIHADNLEAVFKPGRTNFVYGERTSKDMSLATTSLPKDEGSSKKKNFNDNGNDNDGKQSESRFDHCLKLLQRSPSFRLKRSHPVQKDRENYAKLTQCENLMTNSELRPSNSFKTFQSSNAASAPPQQTNSALDNRASENKVTAQITSRENLNRGSYEARSTLKLNALKTLNADVIENERNNRQNGIRSAESTLVNRHNIINSSDLLKSGSTSSSLHSMPEHKAENGAVVNEVLVKNLQFKQDLPSSTTPPPPPPRTCLESSRRQEPGALLVELTPLRNRPLNYNSVLNDDYEKLHSRDHQRENSKIYVTKEEMARKKMMDLLRDGEFDLVKTELERSYTLSTPGAGSPPCSPPPAPAAYISSARASSRRLAAAASLGFGGATNSPERDPLGKLIRYLKSFYRELGTRDLAHLPQWASPLPPGTLCPAHFQPHLQIVHKSEQEHRLENIKMDQIFAPLSDGSISEAPRRVSVEGGPGSGRTTLCLRLLYQWATQSDGPALVFFVPLRELRGGPLLNYLTRELFPRQCTEAIQQVWRTMQLLEERALFVLDGYDECSTSSRASLGDAIDLLEGRLFPEARVLVTCSASDAASIGSLVVHRRLHLAGLEWPHVERLCVAYFIHNDMAEKACEFLEVLNVQPLNVRQLAQHPLGWIMLCVLYQDCGNLPGELSSLVQAAVKCIVKRSLEPAVPSDEEIPAHCRKRLEDFGKLALAALRDGRTYYAESELRQRGGGFEITKLGFLNKGIAFSQRRKCELYTPIHLVVAEFLAAYYLTSVAQYANILRRELEGLPSGIIGYLAGLLGPKTHLVLNQLCPLEVPARAMFSLLKAAGASDGNVAAICRLVGAGPGFGPAPNERPPAPLVHTSPLELEGWARILESSACSLEALEVVFQVERGSDPHHLDEFFEALTANESVKLVRITSLLGQEFPADEVLRLAEHVRNILGKKRLHEFELVITCLEESAHDRLECVVSALCRGLSQASAQLSRLVLDMNLSGEQVSRVCGALRHCPQVQALHLPHLGCGCEGLASVANLLKERPLLALNLAGSWGAKNEDPSSSGISMGSGSGSGSSGCASSTLGSLPTSSRCYSSLPRGALAAYGGSNRPATLPRLPLSLGTPSSGNSSNNGTLPSSSSSNNGERDASSKRNSDSVLCHRLPTLHPPPACDIVSHHSSGFHEIFSAIREPNCKLRSLNVSKCLLGGLDAACLAETIRRARNLDAVRAAGASRPADVIPLVVALAEAPCLQLLDLASPRLALDDHPCRLLCHALARNSTLRLLSLEGWTFRIEESETLSVFSELLRCTNVRELSLCNARLHLAVHEGPVSRLGRRDDAGAELLRAAAPPACPDVVFLRLAGFQVTVNDRLALRGPLLLPFLAGFTGLSELDLSLDKSTIGCSNANSSSQLFIDDRMLVQFFGCLSTHFRGLQSLRINFWRITLEDSERTLRQVGKHLRNSSCLSFVKASGLFVADAVKKARVEHGLIQAFLANLGCLQWLCLDGVELAEMQAASVGKCLRERFAGTHLEVSAKDVHMRALKALVSSVEEGGRAEVLYAGGASCRLKITKLQKNAKSRKK